MAPTMSIPHLLVAVSAHGFGHFAQVAPVVNALRRRNPALRVTLRTALPRALLATRLTHDFELVSSAADFGLRMHTAFDVDVAASLRDYLEILSQWDERVANEARLLRELRPDLVLANIPFFTLAGAALAHIPAVALGSLNWAAILHYYFRAIPAAGELLEKILFAYNQSELFIRPTPSMPMLDIPRQRVVGPIATLGARRSDEIRTRLGVNATTKIALVTPGGIETAREPSGWPRHADIVWIVPTPWGLRRADIAQRADFDWPFQDLVASSDVVVTKPGYGSIAESVCNGVPLILASRGDWPEEPYLVAWLKQLNIVQFIDKTQFMTGAMVPEVLASVRPAHAIEATGIEEAADLLMPFLI